MRGGKNQKLNFNFYIYYKNMDFFIHLLLFCLSDKSDIRIHLFLIQR